MNIKALWQQYFVQYPLSTIQDFIKYLYQATLGSAHLVLNELDNFHYLIKEYDSIQYDSTHTLYERISDDLVRVHLEAIDKNDLKEYHSLFMKSVEVSSSKDELLENFKVVEKGIIEGWIPFDLDEWKSETHEYITKGCPVVSHSQTFRENYHPHYRLMKVEYLPYLELIHEINRIQPRIITIDGRSGSGKSTLASLLSEIYGYPIVHMDDFFLKKEQRTSVRLKEIGGNVDYERFNDEVIIPLLRNKSFTYQIFDCQSMSINDSKYICFDKGIIVEGCYAMHPYFKNYSHFNIFMDISNELQKERILKRNGEFMLNRFVNEWIPKENLYIETFHIKEKADYIINID